MDIKETKCKPKMNNLVYTSLKIQDYLLLKHMKPSQAKALFKFCVRMAPFGEHFRWDNGWLFAPCANFTRIPELIKTIQCIYEIIEEYSV